MITSIDKALVALIMGVVFLVNNFTGFHFGIDEATANAIAGGLTPILVWLTPNKPGAWSSRPFSAVAPILLLVAVSTIVLTACAEPGEKGVTPAEGALFTCETYGDTLHQLAQLNAAGKIKPGDQAVVDGVRETLNPICLGPAPDVSSSVKDVTISNSMQILNTILLLSLSQGA